MMLLPGGVTMGAESAKRGPRWPAKAEAMRPPSVESPIPVPTPMVRDGRVAGTVLIAMGEGPVITGVAVRTSDAFCNAATSASMRFFGEYFRGCLCLRPRW